MKNNTIITLFTFLLLIILNPACGPAPQEPIKQQADSSVKAQQPIKQQADSSAKAQPLKIDNKAQSSKIDKSLVVDTASNKSLESKNKKPEPLMGIQVFVEFEHTNFFPNLRAVFQKPDGTPVADDFISEDGWGLSRNYKKVIPGEYYRLILSSPELANPFFNKINRFTGEVMPRFFFGKVEFVLPEELISRVNETIRLKINRLPSGSLLFDGLFKNLKAVSIYGDTFPHVTPLEAGIYTYTFFDIKKKDQLIICDENGDEALMTEGTWEFVISEESPVVIIDLSSYFTIKDDSK